MVIRSLLLMVFTAMAMVADDWPQWMGSRRDNVWCESGNRQGILVSAVHSLQWFDDHVTRHCRRISLTTSRAGGMRKASGWGSIQAINASGFRVGLVHL